MGCRRVCVSAMLGVLASLCVVCCTASASPCEELVSENLGRGAYSASSYWGDHTSDRAFDGDVNTRWNASTYHGWVEVDLGRTVELSRLRRLLDISPNGDVHYQVWIADAPIHEDTSQATLAWEYVGRAAYGDVFDFDFSQLDIARHVQVRTLESSGWAAWIEIQIFERGEGFCPELVVDNLVSGETAQFHILNARPNSRAAIFWAQAAGHLRFRAGGWCVNFGINLPFLRLGERLVGVVHTDDDGQASLEMRVPAGLSGRAVLFQAAEHGSCPRSRMSNIWEENIQ